MQKPGRIPILLKIKDLHRKIIITLQGNYMLYFHKKIIDALSGNYTLDLHGRILVVPRGNHIVGLPQEDHWCPSRKLYVGPSRKDPCHPLRKSHNWTSTQIFLSSLEAITTSDPYWRIPTALLGYAKLAKTNSRLRDLVSPWAGLLPKNHA